MVSWHVITVDTISAGLEVTQVDPPDVVLLDSTLCNGNDLTMIQDLQACPFEKRISIIALTESTRPLNQKELEQIGIVAVFSQLLDPVILVRKISQTLDWSLLDAQS